MNDYIWYPHPGPQEEFCSRDEFEVFFGGAKGPGKLQPLDSVLITPFGEKKIRDIRVGSVISNPNGGNSRVISIYDFESYPVYKVEFVDGTSTLAGLDHLWLAWVPTNGSKRKVQYNGDVICHHNSRVFTTGRIKELVDKGRPVIIPLTNPVNYASGRRVLKIDPYVLGALLGDGNISQLKRNRGPIRFTNKDDFIIDKLKARSGVSLSKNGIDYVISNCHDLRYALDYYELSGTVSYTKFIPDVYRYASIEERFELINGLFDTDGSSDTRDGHIEYSTVSEQLSNDTAYILRSLGFRVRIGHKTGSYIKDGIKIECKKVYRLSVQGHDTKRLFSLPRKRDNCKPYNGGISIPGKRIKSVEYMGKDDCRCIKIDHPNGLYITNDFIVTHNTDCLIAEATRHVYHPKYHGLILRRTFPRLQEIIDRCWRIYPSLGAYFMKSERRWYFPSGAKITLGHCQHEQDKHNYHGKEFHFIGFDELTEFLESVYLFIMANVRRSVPDLELRIRATSNPGGIGHSWVKARFIDTCKPVDKKKYISSDGEQHEMSVPVTYIDPDSGQSRCFVPATVYDNPSITINDPMYVKRLEMLSTLEKKRFLYGEWDAFEGQVFTELNTHVHGCDSFPIPVEWEKFMSFDWGYSRPWCALWFAVDFDGVIYLYREHYGMVDGDPNKGKRQTNVEICREIEGVEKERVKYRVADPACWAPTKLKGSNKHFGPSFAEDAHGEGLHFIKADNDRIRGIQQVHQRFKLEQEFDDEGNLTKEYPMFVAFTDCVRWWAEFGELREDPNNPEDIDTNAPDEGYDCTRYAFMSRPITPKKKQQGPPRGSFQAERARMIKAKNYAKRHRVSIAQAYSLVR